MNHTNMVLQKSKITSLFLSLILLISTFTPVQAMKATAATPSIKITSIFFDGTVPRVESDEYAVIKNVSTKAINLGGWRLYAGNPGQNFIFPSYVLKPGKQCRVYTNQNHPESCGFSFKITTAIWNNGGDCGMLYNSANIRVSKRCYLVE